MGDDRKNSTAFSVPQVNRIELYDVDPIEIEIGPALNKATGAAAKIPPNSGNAPTRGNTLSRTEQRPTREKSTARTDRSAAGTSQLSWKAKLEQIAAARNGRQESALHGELFQDTFAAAQHWFVLSVSDTANLTDMQVSVMRSTRKQDRAWSRPVAVELEESDIRQIDSRDERAALSILTPVIENIGGRYRYFRNESSRLFKVEPTQMVAAIDAMYATGRLAWKLGDSRQHFEDARPITTVDVETPYQLTLNLTQTPGRKQLSLSATLNGDDRQASIDQIVWLSTIGCALVEFESSSVGTEPDQTVSATNHLETQDADLETCLIRVRPSDVSLIRAWQQARTVTVPNRSLRTMMRELSETQSELPIVVEAGVGIERRSPAPTAKCLLQQTERCASTYDVTLTAMYDDKEVPFESTMRWWFDEKETAIVDRNDEDEARLLAAVPTDQFDVSEGNFLPSLEVPPEAFLEIVQQLQAAGWEVSANGAPIRLASEFNIEVESGVDWFDLNGEVEFDGTSASLPELLRAMKRGEKTILLDDGSHGMLPEDWLNRFVDIRQCGEEVDDSIRFHRSQGLLLDLMLQEVDDVARDRDFSKFVKKLQSFEGVKPVDEPKTFDGTLREYQRTGLGWFEFLQEFGFGGCLADDMGLGKTIQILALLDKRRVKRLPKGEKRKASIVVVPKSLVFNWMDEASKFTPKLRLLNYTGAERHAEWQDARSSHYPPHLIVTTYGTLRNDAATLHDQEFDYVILDEAQAIKNPKSQAAKASRLLRGDHRLAMTGTPVENHLGDLWSLFEFLNPGMLGGQMIGGGGSRVAKMDDESSRKRVEQISRSLRPFILRRTKEQVLTELPDKVEQTLTCEMERPQRKLYDELRDHYRVHLSDKVQELGLKRSKIHVLEALLRLRQAACDPRLVKPDCGVRGSKIENLMTKLSEVVGEGHKALVFSQFTTLLGLLREDIGKEGWDYEYLDGKTRKRAERVKRFQDDEDCPLFLISLKAGGHGLNLTAADYVFILDPWWNPAVEAQAIDRAHRMGQTKSVNAYRMVCSDTVEEKIIELQQAKRDLADAIISQEKSLIGELTADDLQSLLG